MAKKPKEDAVQKPVPMTHDTVLPATEFDEGQLVVVGADGVANTPVLNDAGAPYTLAMLSELEEQHGNLVLQNATMTREADRWASEYEKLSVHLRAVCDERDDRGLDSMGLKRVV